MAEKLRVAVERAVAVDFCEWLDAEGLSLAWWSNGGTDQCVGDWGAGYQRERRSREQIVAAFLSREQDD